MLQCIDALDAGGAERVAVELANSLDPGSFDVVLCATRRGGALAGDIAPHVDLVVLGRSHRWDVAGMVRLCQIVRRRHVAIVHSHGRGTTRLVSAAKAVGGVRALHVSHHHSPPTDLSRAQLLALRLAYRGVDAHVAVDSGLVRWIVEEMGVPPGRVTVVAGGVDLRRFQAARPVGWSRPPADALRVAVVANLREGKGHDALLHAVARSRHRTRLHVGFIGAESEPGYVARLRGVVAREGLGAHVWFAGSRRDVPGLLAGAHIGALASTSESGPIALAEYMASGLPFVVTDVGQLAREAKDEGCGFAVPVGDVDAFRDALDRLVDLGETGRRALGARGRVVAEQRFSQAAATASVEQTYRSLLGPSGPEIDHSIPPSGVE